MSEVSSVVATLVARMETNPEDFEYEGKFYHLQEGLYGLTGLRDDKSYSYWFLNDADKQALIAGWKQWHFKNFEKATYETLFDDKFEERKREKELHEAQMQAMKQRVYQQQMAAQNQMAQSSYPYAVNTNAGLSTLAGNAAQGLTVHSNGSVQMSNTLQIGKEMIDESLITKLKKWIEEK